MASIIKIDDCRGMAERKPPENISETRWPLVFAAACWFLGSALGWAVIAFILSR